MRISDWSSDVCSSDLPFPHWQRRQSQRRRGGIEQLEFPFRRCAEQDTKAEHRSALPRLYTRQQGIGRGPLFMGGVHIGTGHIAERGAAACELQRLLKRRGCRSLRAQFRSEEHTSELQSLMRHSYAVFCLKKKKKTKQKNYT